MERQFTLEYWLDEGWFVGRIKEIPGIFSQGETLEELETNIRDVYQLMLEDDIESRREDVHTKEIKLDVA